MKVLCCKPGEEFQSKNMTADQICEYCEGLIDIVEFNGLLLVVNDEGRINGMKLNRVLCSESNTPGVTTPKLTGLYGPIVAVGSKADGDFRSITKAEEVKVLEAIGEVLTDADAEYIKRYVKSPIYRADRQREAEELRRYYESLGFAYFDMSADIEGV